MAKTPFPSIPPNLVEAQAQIVSYMYNPGTQGRSVGTNSALSRRKKLDKRPKLKIAAERCARWLAARHQPGIKGMRLNDFIYARTTEIKAGIFNPTYFMELTQTADRTGISNPFCRNLFVPTPPQYFDPLRLQQLCTVGYIDREYDSPADGTGLPDPSVGWAGSVNAGVWTDAYHTTRRFEYDRPAWSMDEKERQVFFAGEVTVNVSASHRGTRHWFGLAMSVRQFDATHNHQPTSYRSQIVVRPQYKYRGEVPAPSMPYVESILRPFVIDAMSSRNEKYWDGVTKVEGFISCPPANGQFFSNNDYVIVSLTINQKMYQAIKPGE